MDHAIVIDGPYEGEVWYNHEQTMHMPEPGQTDPKYYYHRIKIRGDEKVFQIFSLQRSPSIDHILTQLTKPDRK
jgi:hypothetical protein